MHCFCENSFYVRLHDALVPNQSAVIRNECCKMRIRPQSLACIRRIRFQQLLLVRGDLVDYWVYSVAESLVGGAHRGHEKHFFLFGVSPRRHTIRAIHGVVDKILR